MVSDAQWSYFAANTALWKNENLRLSVNSRYVNPQKPAMETITKIFCSPFLRCRGNGLVAAHPQTTYCFRLLTRN